MSDTLYELVFDGLLVDGVSYERAQQNVLKLFKASPEQVEKMFKGGRIVLRNKLDRAAGDKYVAVLYKNGLMCRLEEMARQSAEPAQAAPQQAPTQPQASEKPKETEPVKLTRVDEILMNSSLKLDPAGVRMSAPVEVVAPVFSHQSEFEVAPVGVRMSEEEEVIPVPIGDISSISVAPKGSDMGQLVMTTRQSPG